MRIPLSWLRDYVDIPAGEDVAAICEHLVRAGLEVEEVLTVGAGQQGPLVVGRVLEVTELTEFKKPIRFCRVAVGAANGHPDTPGERGIICGASNFAVGDLVVVALPGTVLPGGFEIASRRTYGHISDGMICSERELAIGADHAGILVLPSASAEPGTPAGEILGIGEQVIDVTVTPDIGYCLSLRGVARELATAYGVALRDPGSDLVELPAPVAGVPAGCVVEDLEGCGLYTLATITGFDPKAPTPQWMRTRLQAAGLRSVSLAVDVTNYVMVETGQPLHAFDLGKLDGSITVRRARAGETLETLDHVKRVLSTEDLLIADGRGPIGLAGVMGGLDSEIDDATRDIALESAWFASVGVARTSRRHKLSTDASRRYERGVDRVLAPYASARAAALLLELGGGSYVGMTAVEAPYDRLTVTLDAALPQRIAGIELAADDVVSRLRAVGCEVDGDAVITVTPPSWRPDLTDPYDLVEEVLRLGGYDAIPSRVPRAPVGRGLTPDQRHRRQVSRGLAAFGCTEVLSFPFVGVSDLDGLSLPIEDPRRRMLLLANPLSDQAPGMRTTLLPGLLAAVRRNLGRGLTDLAVYETGAVFLLRADQAERGVTDPPRPSVLTRPDQTEQDALGALLPDQPLHLATAFAGQRSPAGWWGAGEPACWADAVQSARIAARAVGADLQVRPGSTPMPWHPGRCAELVVDGALVGHAGELHPRVISALGLPPRTSVMELDLDRVLAAATAVRLDGPLSGYPVAKEDVALVVGSEVASADVAAALRTGAGELLESVRLFDVYTGEQVGAGRKSLAYALRFRAPDRTLADEEVSSARDAAIAAAAAATGAVLRS
jgi:phenylalanyl-tRNA synthetase beta chain